MKTTMKFQPTKLPPNIVAAKIDRILTPFKLRSREDGTNHVIFRIPTASDYTYMILRDDGSTTWLTADDCGRNYLDEKFEFIGMLQSGESVTITG